ncbi:serine protease Do [Evansella caseinilytica]|uniref:Serine protease Do n=1 Tax=Evansella caseinilytica TaxID=1503961 RepID=A0A1H3Q4E2_9BACI|nr:trypsin-like peptidase domain-containing protein [Evansella caseinilytica]SDZ08374.1 serine protease Do [Evansella caseinilytica]
MGYYDESVEPAREAKKKKRSYSWLSAFCGAMAGALIVVFAIPVLANHDVLPYQVVPKGEKAMLSSDQPEKAAETTVENIPSETRSISMTSEVIEAVERVSDAVVGVINMRESTAMFSQGGEGTGSGVIYKMEGDHAFVVTNYHVIEGANQIEVTLSNGRRIPAEKVGEDALTDLALLKIDAEEVATVATFGSSEVLRPGEPAIAIGNPLTFEGSVTLGIISAVERSIPVDLNGDGRPDWNAEVLQTDAAINPGNSGGALLNIQGEVIGINSMKIAQHAVEGIGFAIPSSIAVPVVEDLEEFGEVRRPQMGVEIRSLNEIPSFHWQETLQLPEEITGGVYLDSVVPDTPAAIAGLQEGDVIVELDGEEVNDVHDLRSFLYTKKKVGDKMTVGFYRYGKKEEVELLLDRQVM